MKLPLLLTIECSGFSPRVALYRGFGGPEAGNRPDGLGQPDAVCVCPPDARSAAELIPMIHGLYNELQISPGETAAVAVTYGPGSFTSLRIGVTTAKMLAFCWRIPAIPINTLDLNLVAGAISTARSLKLQNRPNLPTKLWALTNAYRQQFYCKAVAVNEPFWNESSSPSHLSSTLDPELLAAKMVAFDSHFESSLWLAETFDGETSDDHAPRFDLNENSIQEQEALFPERFWKLEQATDAVNSEALLQQLSQANAASVMVVVTDKKLAATLQDRFGVQHKRENNGSTSEDTEVNQRVIVPTDQHLDEAFAWLAWQSLMFLSEDQVHPFRLQPIYYRPSAAEEAWAHKG